MRLIFIRHGDPDYAHDSLTDKGKREVELLTKRVSAWNNVSKIYVSSMGRAQETAAPSIKALGVEAVTCEWLQEFYYRTIYPDNVNDKSLAGKETMCWDLMPEYFVSDKRFFDKDEWMNSDFMKDGKIEADETPEQCIVREIREELATEVRAEKCIGTVEYDYPAFHLTMHCILCSIISGKFELLEHENAKWLTRETLRTVKWLPADELILDKVENLL